MSPTPSISRRSRLVAVAASVTAIALAGVSPGLRTATAASGAAPSVVLRAAAAVNTQGKIEVRLRWSLQDGWLPDGGFNVYRYDGAAAANTMPSPLNGVPLGNFAIANAPAAVQTGATHSVQVGALLGKAKSSATLPPLSTPVTRGASAQAQFDQLGAVARTAHSTQATQAAIAAAAKSLATAPTGNRASVVAGGAAPAPSVGPVAPVGARVSANGVRRAAPTAIDVTMQARRTLIMSAALHPEVASVLGLSFDDSNVTPGQTYTYRLTNAQNATPLATATITVPQSSAQLKPAAPAGLQAQQLNADSVALRWQRLSSADEASLGVAQYDIYRLSMPDTLAAAPSDRQKVSSQGKKLNDEPVLVTDNVSPSSTSSAAATEAPAFFTDTTPPVVSVTYRVTVTDIFGRTSDPAQLSFAVQDWHKPLPVPYVGGQLMPQQPAQQAAFLSARARQYHRAAPFFKGALGTAPASQQALVVWTPSFQDPSLNTIWGSGRLMPDPGVAYQVYRIDTEQPAQAPVLLTPTPIIPALTPATQLPSVTPISSLVPNLPLKPDSARDALATAACVQIAAQATVLQQGCRQISSTPQFENYLLTPLSVYMYTDTGVSKDHYYQYLVVAVFTRNSQQSSPSASNIVAYPNLTPPASVSSASSSFQVASQAARTSPTPVIAGSKRGNGFNLTDWSGPLVKAPPRDRGGDLMLSWTAGHEDVRYEVYRANATRPQSIQRVPPSASAVGCAVSSAKVAVAPRACTSKISVASTSLNYVTLSDPFGAGSATAGQSLKDSDFVLLGTTKDPKYVDQLARSSAEYYVYRIVPLNRWNVPGPLTSLGVRVQATMPPTKPKLLVGTPAPDGGVEVEFVPDGDTSEEVVSYELWRSTLTTSDSSTASGAAQGGSVGSAGSTTAGVGPAATGTGPAAGASPGVPVGAARYGIQTHHSIVSAAVRSGFAPLSSLTPDKLRALSATRVVTTNASALPAGSSHGAWLVEEPSGSLDWRKEYVYWVRAVDSDQLPSDSDLVDVQPLKVSAATPSGVTAVWSTVHCAVDLTWQRTDPDTAGFLVERELVPTAQGGSSTGTAVSSSGQRITTGLSESTNLLPTDNYVQLSGITAPTAVSYTDTSAFPDNSYSYRVRTIDQAGNTSTPAVSATTVAIPDGCGNTAVHRIQKTSSAGTDSPSSNASTPVASPVAPTVPKPADEIDIPATRPQQ